MSSKQNIDIAEVSESGYLNWYPTNVKLEANAKVKTIVEQMRAPMHQYSFSIICQNYKVFPYPENTQRECSMTVK